MSYLSAKESVIRNQHLRIIPGEEDLLGFYLLTGGLIDSDQHRIKDPNLAKEFQSFDLAEGFWEEYKHSSKRAAMKAANEISYFWDDLIENFGSNILAGSVGLASDKEVTSHERAIRWMAREGRLSRRSLSQAFIDKMNVSREDRRSSRVCFSPFNKDACFVLVPYPRDPVRTMPRIETNE